MVIVALPLIAVAYLGYGCWVAGRSRGPRGVSLFLLFNLALGCVVAGVVRLATDGMTWPALALAALGLGLFVVFAAFAFRRGSAVDPGASSV